MSGFESWLKRHSHFLCCVTLGKLLNFPGPQFLICMRNDLIIALIIELLWKLNGLMYVNLSEKCLAPSSVNFKKQSKTEQKLNKFSHHLLTLMKTIVNVAAYILICLQKYSNKHLLSCPWQEAGSAPWAQLTPSTICQRSSKSITCEPSSLQVFD